jgi:hypothetical protein
MPNPSVLLVPFFRPITKQNKKEVLSSFFLELWCTSLQLTLQRPLSSPLLGGRWCAPQQGYIVCYFGRLLDHHERHNC